MSGGAERRPALAALAAYAGIHPGYHAAGSEAWRPTSDATREALLEALGLDGSSEEAAAATLETLQGAERARILDPVWVGDADGAGAAQVAVALGVRGGPFAWSAELACEDGRTLAAEGERRGRRGAERAVLTLPFRPHPGYHTLHLRIEDAGGVHRASQLRIATPRRCFAPEGRAAAEPGFGLVANLYALRGARDWGIGDLAQLRELVDLTAREGGDFVGVSPLHAVRNRGDQVSPYLPVSRLYRNWIYLDLARVPELAESPEARAQLADAGLQARLASLRDAPRIDYAAVAEVKRAVLATGHRWFAAWHRDADTPRGCAYAAYRSREGEALDAFAAFAARDAGAGAGPEALDFERWLQFELDRQLAALQDHARSGGLRLGLYTDLALGTAADGCDARAFPELFVAGVRAGAPPDDFAPEGQDWGFPPLDPRALRAGGYAYWRRLLRGAFAHTGALRIDHVMGLSRLYWIPPGRPAREGAYVSYPERELLAILALESERAAAVVVGEDLGTVARGFRARLARRGVLSSQVLYFEREADGAFRPARRYSRRALVTANTHDLPTLEGFFDDADLALRRRVGALRDDDALAEARARREADRAALRARLGGPLHDAEERAAAVSRFLGATPAPWVGLAVDDLVAEVEPVNVPGVGPDRHPSWTRRNRVAVEDIGSHPVARAAFDALPAARVHRRRPGVRRRG